MSDVDGITIEVKEPADGGIGSISARTGDGELGPEVVWACGREHGDWYLIVNRAATKAAGLEHQLTHIPCHREDAEYLVRLIAGLYERREW